MSSETELLSAAEELLHMGHPDQAIQICQQLLEHQETEARVFLVLSQSYFQLHHFDAALEAATKAYQLASEAPDVLFWLGKLYLHRKQFHQAERVFRQLTEAHPEHETGWVYLGVTLLEGELVAPAISVLESGLKMHPHSALIRAYLGNAHFRLKQFQKAYQYLKPVAEHTTSLLGDWVPFYLAESCKALQKPEEAVEWYRRVLAVNPANAQAMNNLGTVLIEMGSPDEARTVFQKLVAQYPNVAEYWFNYGNSCRSAGDLQEAVRLYREALRRKEAFFEAHYNLAKVLSDLGDFEESANHFARALKINPNLKEAWVNYLYVLQEMGKVEEALRVAETALARFPENVTLRWNRGVFLLLLGRYREAWPDYELRLQMGQTRVEELPYPRWEGQPISDKTLLIHNDQGLGDAIQFFRFLPRIRSRAGRLVVQIPAPLVRLFAFQQVADAVLSTVPEDENIHYQIPIGSLPGLLNVDEDDVAVPVPYLRVDVQWEQPFHQLFQQYRGLKVGIVWRGNPKHTRDPDRSCELAAFEPLLQLPNVHVFSLQKGAGEGDLFSVPFGHRIVPLGPRLTDMADTAAAIQQLDLVITVDTSVAHLAAALGKPTWILVQYAPDWRWMLHRSDSPWYPTVRLFRQHRWRDWQSVLDTVAEEIRKMV